MTNKFKEKIDFIKKHEDVIKPITSDSEMIENLAHHRIIADSVIDQKRIENILEEFETKIFLCEKQKHEYGADAKKVLLTASEPLAFLTINPIIERLKTDPRCKAIGLLTDNVAGKQFENKNDPSFKHIDNKDLPVLVDALKMAEKEPFDVTIAAVDPINSPQTIALFAGKSSFGSKKLYFISSGWIGTGGGSLLETERAKHADKIDGIFCNDQLAKRIILNQLKEFPKDKIFITGTPVIDTLEIDKAKEHTQTGRKKLGIDDDELAILYLGDVSAAYRQEGFNVCKRINEKTFAETLEAIIKLAEAEPERKFALLIRPHPRDPNKEEMFSIAKRKVPKNLKIISTSKEDVSISEATYSADIIASIASTENFLALLRGRKSVFLGYEKRGMGGDVLKQAYSKEVLNTIKQDKKISIVSSPENLIPYLKKQKHIPEEAEPPITFQKKTKTSTQKILDIALAD